MKAIISLTSINIFCFILSFTASVKPALGEHSLFKDTTPCKLVVANEYYYKKMLSEKYSENGVLNKLIVLDSSSFSINYLYYNRSSGNYSYIKIITDTLGNYQESEIKQNYKRNVNSKRYKRALKGLKTQDYSSLFAENKFLISNCYVSDGSDLLVFVRISGKYFFGIAVVDGLQNYDLVNSIKTFIENSRQLQ